MPDISTPTEKADLNPNNTADAIAQLLMGGEEVEAPAETLETLTDDPDDRPEAEALDGEPDDSQDDDQEAASDDESEEEESLAQLLGLSDDLLDVDEDGNISIRTKINGKEGKAKLEELVKGYQFNQANNEKAQTLAAERKAFEEAQAQANARVEQTIQQAEGLAHMWVQELMGEYQNVNWDELRRLDPGEFAAKQAEFQQRQQKLQQAGQYMAQYKEQLMAEDKAKTNEARAKRLEEQRNIMLENNPSWRDDAVFDKEMGALRSFVQSQYGFTEDDTKAVSDARLIELIKDAAAFRMGKSIAQKKAKPVPPKMQRAANGRFTAKASPKTRKLDKLVTAAKNAKGANKRELERDAIAALLLSGE